MIKEILPLTERKMKILLTLYLWGALHNSKIAEISGIDKQNISLQMKKFKEKGLIRVQRTIGKITEYSLNNNVIGKLDNLLEDYRKDYLFTKYPVLEKVYSYILREVKEIDKIYLIGSYSQETSSRKSDIDLLIISKSLSSGKARKISRDASKLYNVEVDIIVYSRTLLAKEEKSNSKFYQTTLKHKKDNVLLYEVKGLNELR